MRAARLAALLALAACAAGGGAWAQPGAAPAPKPGAPSPDSTQQPTPGDDRAVIEASHKWLKLIDGGKLGEAWDASADQIKKSVTRDAWIKGIREARRPFGKLVSRKEDRFARTHSLPGAPDGDYALLIFETEFEKGRRANEHLTWFLDPNGGWRVSGYFIR